MTLEQQVANIELSKRLREFGVKQESIFYWYETAKGGWVLVNGYAPTSGERFSAFTTSELGEMFPYSILKDGHQYVLHLPFPDGMKETSKSGGYLDYSRLVDASYPTKLYWNSWQDTEADARASMLVHLIENKLITL